MIDPGNPFLQDRDFATLVEQLQESVLNGVTHEATTRFVFDPEIRVYDLPQGDTAVVRVSGLLRGGPFDFVAGDDYDAGLSRVVWRIDAKNRPDPQTQLVVTFAYKDIPSGLRDVGPGSVVGTLLRAFGRELALLHQQVNEAYRRAFLDTASGVALDGVVALLGVTRNPEQRATGAVTFTRSQTTRQLIVPAGVIVEDAAQRSYQTTADAVFAEGEDEADAAVRAVEAGPGGNNAQNALTVMPTPPTGVVGVTNDEPITGGLAEEPDDALRERARHSLDRVGSATSTALEAAVRDVDGVEDVAVIDRSVDPTVPLGEVRVRFSANGVDSRLAEIHTAVSRVVEATRAAGIKAIAETVEQVTIAGKVIVVGTQDGAAAGAAGYRDALVKAINGARIGEPLSTRKLVAMAFAQPGLTDVLEAQLEFTRGRPPNTESDDVGDLLPVGHAEHTVAGEITVVPVDGLRGDKAVKVGDEVPIGVRLLHGTSPLRFSSVKVQVRVEVRAGLLSTPNQPPEVVADVVKEVFFDQSELAVLTLTAGSGADQDLHGFDPTKHATAAHATLTVVGSSVPAGTADLTLG
ncbi:baseplate J/gp47 family protein [Humibacillus xanthopallidus]|uniref:Putative phage protein gp47/JayE n=1 Tax=Humibacillus xanthopallidus TaxID=412689 RepID=A0A543HUK1_9MICO|nr:baseplate J/gp47 family protein [Humibacillus xanthopallidus]TQM61949.1 putative phage protein gp47/JayE [Humibacillus xanthopallidus]